jgi:2-phosphosulfolactate phosphatase
MLVRLNHKVHVLFRRQDLDMVRLDGKVVIVLDVLFATSTMVAALAHGATEVIPTLNEHHARDEAKRLGSKDHLLSGELFADVIEGFAPPTPLALLKHDVRGRTLIYATTNGTVALKEASAGQHVFAGALLNADAVVKHIARTHPEGSMGNPNLEDMYGAGYFVDLIARELGEQRDFSDAAWAARALFRSEAPESALLRCRVGKMMQERGLTHEVKYAAQLGVLDIVPKLIDGRLEPVAVA